jgi:ABC-type spermidine/putrescine transport system permease subunit I
VFIDTVGDPVNAALLGGTGTYTIGQAIQDAYLTNQQYNVAAADRSSPSSSGSSSPSRWCRSR